MDSPGRLGLQLVFLAEEPDLEQGGRILAGDTPIASLLPRRGRGVLETLRVELEILEGLGDSELRVDTLRYAGGPGSHLRIAQVTWQPRV